MRSELIAGVDPLLLRCRPEPHFLLRSMGVVAAEGVLVEIRRFLTVDESESWGGGGIEV